MNVSSFKSQIKIVCNRDLVKHVIPKMLQEALMCDCYLNLRFCYIVLSTDFRIEKCVMLLAF